MIRTFYRMGMAQAFLEKTGALIDVSDVSAPDSTANPLGIVAGAGLGGTGALLLKSFLRGAQRGRSPKSRALWGTLGTAGALGLGGWLGSKALENKE